MTLEKLYTLENYLQRFCHSRSHKPPTMLALEPGIYKWTCPDCGKATVFHVNKPSW